MAASSFPFPITTTSAMNGTANNTEEVLSGHKPLIPRSALSISLTVGIAIVMVGMGCGIDVSKLKQYLCRPTGVIVGVISQFVFMPTIAFALAKALQMSSIRTLALLIVGSCPGGAASNTMTYWVGGDIGLSVTMTAVSSTLGFGMMPFLLWLYSFGFGGTLTVPYKTIGITLGSLIGPVFIGILIRIKFPKQAPIILKVLAVFGILAIIALAVLSLVTYNGLLNLTKGQFICAAAFPGLGMLLGYGLSSLISLYKPLWLPHYQRRTISIETGIQNGHLAATIIQLSNFSAEDTGKIVLFPVAYAFSQLMWVLLMMFAYRIHRCMKKPSTEEERRDDNMKDTDLPDSKELGQLNQAFDPITTISYLETKDKPEVITSPSFV